MYKTFMLPLKALPLKLGAFALSALFILTACGGFTLDLNLPTNSDCIANPFGSECGEEYASFRQLIADDCANSPEKANTSLCLAADAAFGAPDAEVASESCEDNPFAEGCGSSGESAEITPKDTLIKSEFDKSSFTKTDDEKVRIATLEIVDLCTNPATAHDKQCTLAVVDCINNPFSGRCQGDNVLGNFVRDGVTLSKTVILQDKRAEDCRTGSIDRALCQNLSVQKQRCAGAAFSTDEICTSVAYSVCKADAFDPLCGEKEDFQGVYFSERSNVCYDDPKNPHCTGRNGHVAVVCSEYPFDRLCTGNADYDTPRETACRAGTATTGQCVNIVAGVCSGDPFDPLCDGIANYENARANACETDPTVSSDCPAVPVVDIEEEGTELEVTVNVCLNNPFDSTCVGVQYDIDRTTLISTCVLAQIAGQRTAQCDAIFDEARPCLINPFDSACDTNDAIGTYIGLLRSTRVEFCNSSLRIASYCTGVPVPDTTPVVVLPPAPPAPATPEVTASVWADSFAQGVLGQTTSGIPNDTQFLKVNESDTYLNFPVSTSSHQDTGHVYLRHTLTLDGLGGDRADGYGIFEFSSNTNNSQTRYYAGILPGTNLGAPLTQTTGSAKWTGFFNLDEHDLYESFVLNIEFNGTGGSIESLIQRDIYDYHTTGSFNDAGVITGNVQIGEFRNPDPANRGRNDSDHQTATLTGLIGEEGAVGAFVGNDTRSGSRSSSYAGGFVARPSTTAELQTLAQTCANDPFNSLCAIGYESQRRAVIERCIIGGNASDASCGSAVRVNYCIKYPFGEECADRLPLYYEQARTSRLNFCLSSANAGNALCTLYSTYDHICTNHPFSTQCLGDSDYRLIRRDACSGNPFAIRCAGDVYNDLRVSFCENNAGNDSCPAPTPTPTPTPTPQVTAEVWVDSFDEDLSHGVTAEDTESQFLIARETDLDTGGVRSLAGVGTLNLADNNFNRVALGGDRADGVAFFRADRANGGGVYVYAGILSGTNLGAPLTDTTGSAKWIGTFQTGGAYQFPKDFVLNISFGAGDGAGEIEAFVQTYTHFDYHIKGEFDDAGVITGIAQYGVLRRNDPNNRGETGATGALTGLIGEEGAVGAFIIGSRYGGFVARPSSTAELRTLAQTCADNPFHKHCTIGYESARNTIIDHCIIGDNANDERCDDANEWNRCINDPFASYCERSLPDHYEELKAGRLAFCRRAVNAGNTLCTDHTIYNHICQDYPFDALCRGDDLYRPHRRQACLGNPFAPRCAGEVYNDLRVSFCEGKVGTHSSCPHPSELQHPAGHVTKTVWADSFDEGEPATKAARTDTVSKFLKGRAGDLDTGGIRVLANGNINYSGTLTLSGIYNNGDSLDGDAADGVAFFAAEKVNGRFLSYAGILSGTDLGGPVTKTEGVAEWLGSFQFEGYSATNFTLNVVFGGGDEAGLINAIVQNYTNNDFHVAGSFDDTGVITGNVYLGTFRVNQDPISYGVVKYTAELTGLIGQQGAVGAFVGHTSSTTGFAGGFVAVPQGDEKYTVRTLDWLASFDTEPVSIPTDRNSQFLKASATGFNLAEIPGVSSNNQHLAVLTLADNAVGGRNWGLHNVDTPSVGASLGGHGADGVAFFGRKVDGAYYRYYAGILANTDLGLPLEPENTPTYEWKGVFHAIGTSSLKTDFTLKVTYTGGHYAGTVEAFINRRDDYYYHIKGNFSHSSLILSGTVDYGQYRDGNRNDPIARGRRTGVLSGLIGEEGAIGAFIADSYSVSGYYSGGFVAVSNFVDLAPPDEVTTADWLASFDTPLATRSPIRLQHNGYRNWDQFLRSAPSGPDAGVAEVLQLTYTGFDNSTFDGQSLDEAATGGLYSLHTYYNGLISNFASIHFDTDLGAPLNEIAGTKMIWYGTFQTSIRDYGPSRQGRDYNPQTQDFALEINFGAGSKVGTVEAFVRNLTSHSGIFPGDGYHYVKGEFDANGVIDGTVKNGAFRDHDRNRLVNDGSVGYTRGVLSGLIGQDGAVGVFQGGTGSGGFVAAPIIAFNSNVKYSDWVNGFDAGELHNFVTPYKLDPLSYFVRSDANGLNIKRNTALLGGDRGNGQSLTDIKLDLSDINSNLDSSDGLSYMDAIWSPFTDAGYVAGILSDTNLGSALVTRPADTNGNPNKATWGGKLGLISGSSSFPTRDIGLVVDYTNQTIHNTSSINGAHKIVLNGSWANSTDGLPNGVINGDITYTVAVGSIDHVGVVKGLIGQDGAVGVFVRNGVGLNYAGGFVAHPSAVFVPDTTQNWVTMPDWLASFETAPATVADVNRNHFLQNPNALPNVWKRLNFDTATNSNSFTNISFYSLELDDDIFQDGGGDASDGIFFYKAHNGDESDSYFYAGILYGTALGAPLTKTSGTATWNGRFHAVLSGSVLREFSRDFTLDITFNATGGEISTAVSGRTEDYFELDGTFNNRGVISGTANHVYYENGRIGGVTGDIVNSGPVTGLIGQEGAVGAFISDRQTGNTGGFAGGFVARPPSE